MKKKLTALLLICAMILPCETTSAYADEIEETERVVEQEMLETGTEETENLYAADVFAETAKAGGGINWNYPDNIIPTDTETAKEDCVLVGVKGTYLADAQNALAKINKYRKEACDKGYPDPRDASRSLTSSDYVPIKWSSDLEYIARIRAAEASVLLSHTRPNGDICFSLDSPNAIESYGEVLAWNMSDSMLTGIEQWYGEKEDWLDQNADAVTGHYTSMIDPDNIYVGIATFLNDEGVYPNATSGEFTSQTNLDETTAPAMKDCTQIIEVQKDSIEASIDGLKDKLEVDAKGTAKLGLTMDGVKLYYMSGTTGQSLTWRSSDEKVAKVDQKGKVTALAEGKTTISVSSDCGMKASQALTVTKKAPAVEKPTVKLANGTKGVVVSWTKSKNVTGYMIYRKEKQSDSWSKLKTVDNQTTSWTDTSAKAGKNYYYTVVAYRDKLRSAFDKDKSITRLTRPAVSTSNASKGIKISWKKITGAQKYAVYKSQYSNSAWSKWTKIAAVKKDVLSYTDTEIKEASKYKYTVRAVKDASQSAFESGTAIYRLSQPEFTVSSTSKGITVKLKANKKIDGYRIYKKDSDGKWKKVATTKASKAVSWTDTNVKKNKKYTYTVRAYKGNDASSYHAGKSAAYKPAK